MKKTLFAFLLIITLSFQSFGGDEEVQKIEKKMEDIRSSDVSGFFGGSALMNPNISLILNVFAYTSNRKSRELTGRFFPAHVRELGVKKGFNLESAELFFFAPVDPYFNLYASIPITEEGIELEEIYFVTTSLPEGFQIKGGKFRSGIGRINSQHPHQWDFADSPLPYPEFLGGDGIREKGVQITYLPEFPLYTLLGIEALQGENEILFDPESRSGPGAFSAFLKISFDIGENSTVLFGPSAITGKTKTDSVADDTEFRGHSTLYGLELTYKWKPSKKQGFALQSEYLYRIQKGELEDTIAGAVEPLKRYQDGLYAQGIYQLARWRLGARYDVLHLFNFFSDIERRLTRKPWRATGMLELNPTEFSRIRFQYNHDRSTEDGRINHEVLLQVTMGIGAHAPHPF